MKFVYEDQFIIETAFIYISLPNVNILHGDARAGCARATIESDCSVGRSSTACSDVMHI